MDHPVLGWIGIWPAATGIEQRKLPRPAEPTVVLSMQGGNNFFTVFPLVQLVGARIPDRHLTATVLTLGNRAFEGGILHRVILGLDREVILLRIGRWPFGQGPRCQNAVVFEAKIPVQRLSVVLLNHKGELICTVPMAAGAGFGGAFWVAFGPIDFQPVG